MRLPLFALCAFVLSARAHAAEAISVSAAASLKAPMLALIKQFETENPDTKVRSNFAGSSQLAAQIEQGARVNVFASADRKNIESLSKKGFIDISDVLAHNKLALIFNARNAKAPPTLEALARPGLRLVAPSPNIPAGTYLETFLSKADAQGIAGGAYSSEVKKNVVSTEPDIRMVTVKVAMGEGDAGVVYVTDVTPDLKEKLTVVDIPSTLNVRAEYMVGLVKGGASISARKFYDFLLSPKGQSILAGGGFLPAR